MEGSDDASSSPVNQSSPSHRHLSSDDVIAPGQRVTCSGDGEDVASVAPLQCVDLVICTLSGPIRRCSDDLGAGLSLRDDRMSRQVEVKSSSASSDGVASCTEGPEVNQCGGGACSDGVASCTEGLEVNRCGGGARSDGVASCTEGPEVNQCGGGACSDGMASCTEGLEVNRCGGGARSDGVASCTEGPEVNRCGGGACSDGVASCVEGLEVNRCGGGACSDGVASCVDGPEVNQCGGGACSDGVASCVEGPEVNQCGGGANSDGVASCVEGPEVNRCGGGASSDGVASCIEGLEVNRCGGGASRYMDPVTPPSDSDSDTQEEDVTSDLPEVSSDDDAFATEPPRLPAAAAAPRYRNTFQCGRRQSAPGQLVQDAGGSDPELQSRRPEIAEYFSRKQRSVSQSVPGWKLFGKVPPKQSPSRRARLIQQEFEARQVAARSSPTHHAAGQQSRRKTETEPPSTTALILEDRPPNLPAKSAEETQRHRQQYEQMVADAKRRELKEAQRRQQLMKERVRQEEVISNATLVWNHDILPCWDTMRSSRRTRDLWWGGLPPSVRGRVWSLAVGNELNITAELYDIFLSRAKEKWRTLGETDDGAPSSLELITRDTSRTLTSLCVFQKGGPYHDLLQSILGAYTCYRPDVGYVQGMSSMAAMLILNMDEVQVFISFSNLINRPLQLAFCRLDHQLVRLLDLDLHLDLHLDLNLDLDLNLINRPLQLAFCRLDHQLMFRYFGVFQMFLQETLPRLFLHFQSSGVTPDLYLLDWILSLFVKPLPLDVACRVWDVLFRDGEEFLFRTALGILRLHQDVLLDLDLVSIAQFLSRLPDEPLLSDRLFSCIAATPLLSGNRKWTQVMSSCRDSESS
ncbi:TBC1 domain family member 12-like isoform X2 [Sebastes fasciatus]|uniref:TBC1 domain family member 12-like isoform X2 n=1 Tax=Sebastes fasciatus TaxID=394691 RepID=UPI003D9DC57E